MTTLEAVNRILLLCQLGPVQALDTGKGSFAGLAEAQLDAASKRLQSRGWHANTELDIVLEKDANDEITVPADVLVIDTANYSAYIDVIKRGSQLFWRDTAASGTDGSEYTTVFDDDIHVDLIRLRPLADLPDSLADYIACAAAVQLYNSHLANRRDVQAMAMRREIRRELDADLLVAKVWAEQEENDNSDVNVLNTPGTRRVLGRRHRPYMSL